MATRKNTRKPNTKPNTKPAEEEILEDEDEILMDDEEEVEATTKTPESYTETTADMEAEADANEKADWDNITLMLIKKCEDHSVDNYHIRQKAMSLRAKLNAGDRTPELYEEIRRLLG